MKQKPITLNLTLAEAECIKALLENLLAQSCLNWTETRACRPLITRLKQKVENLLPKPAVK